MKRVKGDPEIINKLNSLVNIYNVKLDECCDQINDIFDVNICPLRCDKIDKMNKIIPVECCVEIILDS